MDDPKDRKGPGKTFPDILYVLIKRFGKIEILVSPAKSSNFL